MPSLRPGSLTYVCWQQIVFLHHKVDWQPSSQMQDSIALLDRQLQQGQAIYGVNTLFGSMADQRVSPNQQSQLQHQLLLDHALHVGKPLPIAHVRAAMLLRVNSLAQGYSAIRPAILQRYLDLLNDQLTPVVYDLGSIGASGDLVPLATLAASALALPGGHGVYQGDQIVPAEEALSSRPRLQLKAKEGIALINGTSFSTAIAGNVMLASRHLLAHQLQLHAATAEVMQFDVATLQAEFQQLKPFPGQLWVSRYLQSLLQQSAWVHSRQARQLAFEQGALLQDRYSLRCLPQFWSPMLEQFERSRDAVLIEANSVTDNPVLINGQLHHGGHFLAQHIAWAMDGMRQVFSQAAKHIEAQISMLVEPAYSRGLPASLSLSSESVAVKPLQLASNAITPQIQLLANPMTNLFPVHAEQLNQNINSLAFGSANLADQSLDWLAEQSALFALIVARALLIRRQQLGCQPNAIAYFDQLAEQVGVPLANWPDQQNRILRQLKQVLLGPSLQPVFDDHLQLVPVGKFS